MKKSKKAFKSSLYSGHKGKVVIHKTNLSLRKALTSELDQEVLSTAHCLLHGIQ